MPSTVTQGTSSSLEAGLMAQKLIIGLINRLTRTQEPSRAPPPTPTGTTTDVSTLLDITTFVDLHLN